MTDMIGQPVTDAVRRDRYGRYQVLPPEGGKVRGYTRATTVAKALDDTSSLMTWNARMTALGLAARADLYGLLTAADPDDRKTIDGICKRASEAGGATVRRDLGTAIHAMLEQSYTNPDYVPPAQYAADVVAVHQALSDAGARVLPEYVERMVVLDAHEIAGTCDGVLEIDGERFLFDNKTGSLNSLKFGNLAWAIQMAIYAHADALYTQGIAADGTQDMREPMPQVSRERAVIIHIEPNSAHCTLHWIDLTVGFEALQVALQVRQFRKVKPLQPFTPTESLPAMAATITPNMVDDDWRASVRERLQVILANPDAKQMVAYSWPETVPTLKSGEPITTEQGERITGMLSMIEREHQLPFPTTDMTPAPEPAPAEHVRRPAPDEGRTVTTDEIETVNTLASALPEGCREIVSDVMKACTKANRPIRLTGRGGKPTEHRMEVCKALVAMAHFDDQELIMAAISIATQNTRRPVTQIGDAMGSLSISEAKNVQGIADAIAAGSLLPMWGDDGVAYLFGDWPTASN